MVRKLLQVEIEDELKMKAEVKSAILRISVREFIERIIEENTKDVVVPYKDYNPRKAKNIKTN